jgi:hypothetical protein
MQGLAIIFGIFVGLSIAAVILSSACSLVRVEPPSFFFSMTICMVIGLIVFVVQLAAGVAGTLGAGLSLANLKTAADFQHLLERGLVVGVLSTPFVSAGIYCAALRECSYLRGLLVWVAQFVVIALLILGVWAAAVGLGLTGRH